MYGVWYHEPCRVVPLQIRVSCVWFSSCHGKALKETLGRGYQGQDAIDVHSSISFWNDWMLRVKNIAQNTQENSPHLTDWLRCLCLCRPRTVAQKTPCLVRFKYFGKVLGSSFMKWVRIGGDHILRWRRTRLKTCVVRGYTRKEQTHTYQQTHTKPNAHTHTHSLSHTRDFENYYPWSKTVDFTHILLTIFPSQSYYCLFTYIHTHIRMCSRLNSYTWAYIWNILHKIRNKI